MNIIYGNVWDTIISESKNAKIKRVAVSFFTVQDLIAFKSGDQLIVDASPETIASGGTCAIALKALFEAGVNLYSLKNFHGKMFHFGNKVIIGSSNISNNSKSNLTEIIQISDKTEVLSESFKIFNELAGIATPIDRRLIHILLTIKVNKRSKDVTHDKTLDEILFILHKVPSEPSMLRAYFLALIELQIGKLNTEKSFKLWRESPNLETHLDNNRLVLYAEGKYKLTDDGIEYFNRIEQKPTLSDYNAFIKALRSGAIEDLPSKLKDKRLKLLY
jgi:phosphatidylserine/phosphatidylglycerophosphate/cardiolipin synthase-like enzyme